MILKNVKSLEADRILAKAIYDKQERLLLNKGAVLGKNQLDLLQRFGIQGVYVEPTSGDEINGSTDDFGHGVNKSNFTEITFSVEFGLPNGELSTLPTMHVRKLEDFLNALNDFAGHLVIHTSYKAESLQKVAMFKNPLPSTKTDSYRQIVRVMNASVLIYHPDEQSGKIPNVSDVFWFEFKKTLFSIQILSIKNKLQNMPPEGELIKLTT